MKGLISNIYAIERKDERTNNSEWESYGNKMLLWHGTTAQNIVGILQSGFRIGPSNAGFNGTLFGKGVYFADTISKALVYTHNYHYHNRNKSKKVEKKYVFLCEVLLGTMKEYVSPTQPPKTIPGK
jgi:poly [ADP-ribose] polymerase 2/3/4